MGAMYDVNQSTGAIGDPVMGDGPIVGGNAEFTKLWENPSPSQAFSFQEIDIGSNNYDSFMIESTTGTVFIKKSKAGYILVCGTSSAVYHIWSRYISTSSTKVNIYDCNKVKMADGTASTDNSMSIPLTIYGIKFKE